MFSAGFQEGTSAEIQIKDTSSAALKALLKYLYTGNMEVDDATLLEEATLSYQYQVMRLHNLCLHRFLTSIIVQNAVMWLMQAHAASGEGPTWANTFRRTTISYVTRNFEEIRCNAMATLVLLEREHPDLFHQLLKVKCGLHLNGVDDVEMMCREVKCGLHCPA
jgi:hypothetical protein